MIAPIYLKILKLPQNSENLAGARRLYSEPTAYHRELRLFDVNQFKGIDPKRKSRFRGLTNVLQWRNLASQYLNLTPDQVVDSLGKKQ